MSKKMFCVILSIVFIAASIGLLVAGCNPGPAAEKLKANEQAKINQSADIIAQTPVPQLNTSIDRLNLIKKLTLTNNPNTLQWIYPAFGDRVIGRFPVRGKVTSGAARLTPTKTITYFSTNNTTHYELADAPDELGVYREGAGNSYIFWLDPADQLHQHCGYYFLSPVPYRIDIGNGMITTELDFTEDAKRALYDKMTDNVKAGK